MAAWYHSPPDPVRRRNAAVRARFGRRYRAAAPPLGRQLGRVRSIDSRICTANSGRLASRQASHIWGGHAPHTGYGAPQSVHRVLPTSSGRHGSPQPWHSRPVVIATASASCILARCGTRRPNAVCFHTSLPTVCPCRARPPGGAFPRRPWYAPLTRPKAIARLAPWGVHVPAGPAGQKPWEKPAGP